MNGVIHQIFYNKECCTDEKSKQGTDYGELGIAWSHFTLRKFGRLCQIRSKCAHGIREIINGFLSHSFSQIHSHLRIGRSSGDLQNTGIAWVVQ